MRIQDRIDQTASDLIAQFESDRGRDATEDEVDMLWQDATEIVHEDEVDRDFANRAYGSDGWG